jgi:hypothetical protein
VRQDLRHVRDLASQLELAPGHARQVEQVVDEARLELDVAADQVEVAAQVDGETLVLLQARD